MTQASINYAALDAWVDAHFDEEVRFLQQLVQVPTDTPPGNNAPHAERTAELLHSFGYEAEHHALSLQMAEAALLPAIRRAPTAIVVADGTSCRHQIADGTEREAIHVARLLEQLLVPTATH